MVFENNEFALNNEFANELLIVFCHKISHNLHII